MAAIRTVFLSSTGADLRDYREAAFLALQKLDDWKCVRMEDFEATDRGRGPFCRAEVKRCDLFIGLSGIGSAARPKGARSLTHSGSMRPLAGRRSRFCYFWRPTIFRYRPTCWSR